MQAKEHWERVYQTKPTTQVSWFQEKAERSLRLIRETGVGPDAAILDVGGGASVLVDDLLAAGYRNVTVLDLSAAALEAARKRLGPAAGQVRWLEADITQVALPEASLDVWHDRAVFHFLTAPADRERYVQTALKAVKPGGHLIVATFAEDGPLKCSGLDIVRYSPEALHAEFGPSVALEKSEREQHRTPGGSEQRFIYCYCRR
jgi:SAM-dependent methyltransferase